MSILTRDRIYFLLKDPYWSFLWWQVSWSNARAEIVAREGRGAADAGPLAIRIHDVTDIIFDGHNSHGYVDLEQIGRTDHWYFQLPAPGRNYCAEIGIKRGSGLFVIVRSNTLFVPRAGPSDSHEERWTTIETTGELT
jgi:hypothetical protein